MILSRAISRQAYPRPPQAGKYTSSYVFSNDRPLFGNPALKKTVNNADGAQFSLTKGKYFPNSTMSDGNGTVEFWINPSALNVVNRGFFSPLNSTEVRINARTGSPPGFSVRAQYNTGVFETGIGRYPLNTWSHIAMTLEDNLFITLWIAGNRIGTIGNGTSTFAFAAGGVWTLGVNAEATPYYLREFRISKSVRYDRSIATYTVPTGPFVNDADTYMLFHLDGSDENAAGIRQLIDDVTVQPVLSSFIMEVNTNNGGSPPNQFILPTTGSGYNFTVAWGDGVTESYAGTPGAITHVYSTPGVYDVQVNGDFPRIFFANSGDKNKATKIKQWGSCQWSSFEDSFQACTNLDVTAADAPDLSGVTSLRGMFTGVGQLGTAGYDFNQWDTSTIIDMTLMFTGATNFNRPLGNWNTSNVTGMIGMFFGSVFNQDISTWCVELIPSEPSQFSSSLSPANKPLFGVPC